MNVRYIVGSTNLSDKEVRNDWRELQMCSVWCVRKHVPNRLSVIPGFFARPSLSTAASALALFDTEHRENKSDGSTLRHPAVNDDASGQGPTEASVVTQRRLRNTKRVRLPSLHLLLSRVGGRGVLS